MNRLEELKAQLANRIAQDSKEVESLREQIEELKRVVFNRLRKQTQSPTIINESNVELRPIVQFCIDALIQNSKLHILYEIDKHNFFRLNLRFN